MQRYTFPPAGGAEARVRPGAQRRGRRRRRLPRDRRQRGGRLAPRPLPGLLRRALQPAVRLERRRSASGGWVGWDEGGEVTVSFGISFVDEDGARRNLEAEAPDFDFDADAVGDARGVEPRAVEGPRHAAARELDLKSFYTALYRSQLHPNTFTDVDGRYRGMDDQIHEAKGRIQYSNFSSWDLYKSWHQLVATIQPERYGDMLLSLLADHREGGFIPRWKEQSIDAGAHVGRPGDPDDRRRRLPRRAEEEGRARRSTTPRSTWSRGATRSCSQLGWLPDRPGTTLEYGVADFALALLAHRLGKDAEARGAPAAVAQLPQHPRPRDALDPRARRGRQLGDAVRPGRRRVARADDRARVPGGQLVAVLVARDARRARADASGWAATRWRSSGSTRCSACRPRCRTGSRPSGSSTASRSGRRATSTTSQVPWMYHFAGQPWRAAAELADARHLYRPTIDGLPGQRRPRRALVVAPARHARPGRARARRAVLRARLARVRARRDRHRRRHVHDRVAGQRPVRRERVAERRAARPRLDPPLRDERRTLRLERSTTPNEEWGARTARRAGRTSQPSAAASLAALPLRLALLAEGLHALAEVLAAEAALAQLDQLALEVRRAACPGGRAAR